MKPLLKYFWVQYPDAPIGYSKFDYGIRLRNKYKFNDLHKYSFIFVTKTNPLMMLRTFG